MFFGVFLIILGIGVWLAEYDIIIPVNVMAIAASAFAKHSDESLEEGLARIRRLKIRTGDEIENLYHAFTSMTQENVRYVEENQKKTETLKEMQNGLIMVLADMVESRDENTGHHVRKTAAYVRIIMEQLRSDGIYMEQLTDEFMYDVVNSAPLHDIGKIKVPDAILNKPGKLTDEEFAIMKSHAAEGRDILTKAIETVPYSDYLNEARNLAGCHHEKWNGTGYPDGLSGEEIPLSARIMAVADVFDALVSNRSYKKGFPFEKAIAIIREGIGTHFDPKVAEAFLKAEDEVRRVAETFDEN